MLDEPVCLRYTGCHIYRICAICNYEKRRFQTQHKREEHLILMIRIIKTISDVFCTWIFTRLGAEMCNCISIHIRCHNNNIVKMDGKTRWSEHGWNYQYDIDKISTDNDILNRLVSWPLVAEKNRREVAGTVIGRLLRRISLSVACLHRIRCAIGV